MKRWWVELHQNHSNDRWRSDYQKRRRGDIHTDSESFHPITSICGIFWKSELVRRRCSWNICVWAAALGPQITLIHELLSSHYRSRTLLWCRFLFSRQYCIRKYLDNCYHECCRTLLENSKYQSTRLAGVSLRAVSGLNGLCALQAD